MQSSNNKLQVADIMTSTSLHTVAPGFSVDKALEVLVENRISGVPVVDSDNIVVGVVSDYDLLNLDGILAEQVRIGALCPLSHSI
jgi:CBS domain-containing protein